MSGASTNPISEIKSHVDNLLSQLIKPNTCNNSLNEAMLYALMAGGKRLRPLLCYACAITLDTPIKAVDNAALAIECLHTYSLIHDDLPSMDDDELRRGKPTVHVCYDEATAILAGDALQTLAFELLATPNNALDATQQCEMCFALAKASGQDGMVGGQAIDLALTGNSASLKLIENMHQLKTGQLLSVSVELALIAAKADQKTTQAIQEWIKCLGLAFQIQDDILDVEATSQTLGKTAGKDLDQNKPTYVKIAGIEQAKNDVKTLLNKGLKSLQNLPIDTSLLQSLSYSLVNRSA